MGIFSGAAFCIATHILYEGTLLLFQKGKSMPVFQRLIDYNRLFHQLRELPIIINDLDDTTEESRDYIDQLITTRYNSDMLSILPSCQCGETKGEYSIGVICPQCKTPVKSQVEEDIEPLVWFRRPKDVDKLINLQVLIMLRKRFCKSGFNIIDWLLDTTFRTDKKMPPILKTILGAGIQRGYNNFVEGFDKIMQVLFTMSCFKLKKGKRDYLYELLQLNRNHLFSDYIPLPNKALLIIEKTNLGNYVDNVMVGGIDAIKMITSIDKKFSAHHARVRENRTAKALVKLCDFYKKFNGKNISGKPGLMRKHVYGARTHFSFRAVITSLTGDHRYDEIHVPWGIGVTVFREHLLSKLLRLGYALNDALGLLYGHVQKYNPMLDVMFKEIIAESGGGIPILIERNPSFLQGSIQRMFITVIKVDTNDNTIGFPILSVRAPSADIEINTLII